MLGMGRQPWKDLMGTQVPELLASPRPSKGVKRGSKGGKGGQPLFSWILATYLYVYMCFCALGNIRASNKYI